MSTFAVIVKDGKRYAIGAFAQSWDGTGWRFIPYNQHSPSRKAWPSAESALPRWAKGALIVEAQSVMEAMQEPVA